MTSPTQRSLALLRAEGYTAAIVERWNQYAKVRQDLFGFIDLVCIRPGEVIGVQTTTSANMAARITKIRGLDTFPKWLAAGGLVEVHGWAKKGPRGKVKKWAVRRARLTQDGLSEVA